MANWEKLIEEHYNKKKEVDASLIMEMIDLELENTFQSGVIDGHAGKRLSTKGKKKAGGEPYDEDPPKARSKSAPAGFGVLEEEMEDLEEATLSRRTLHKDPARLATFLQKIRDNEEFQLATGGTIKIDPKKSEDYIEYIKRDERPPSKLKLISPDGKQFSLSALQKTKEFGGGNANKGDVAEGVLGAAIYARFMYPDRLVTTDDVRAVLNSIAQIGGGSNPRKSEATLRGTVGEDKVNFKVALAPSNFAALISTDPAMMAQLSKIYKSSVAYVNNERIVDLAGAPDFDPNPNIVDVTSDGLSDQKGTKVDVKVEIDGKQIRLGNISLKTLSSTMGQTGKSWNVTDEKSGKSTGIVPFFKNAFGVEPASALQTGYEGAISAYMSLPKDNKGNTKTEEARRVKEEVRKVYNSVVDGVKNFRAVKADGEDDPKVSAAEAQFMKNVVKGIKNAVTLGDDSVKLLSFGGGDYKLLDLTTLGDAMVGYDLDVSMVDGDTPKILIKGEGEGKTLEFIQIRMKLESKPMVRHYFEKKSGLDKLFAIANEKAKQAKQK